MEKMKILIVDDNKDNLYMLQGLLEGRGYEVVSSTNGANTLDKARRDTPDMIISDILMPEMDGFQLCRGVKEDEKLRHIPFVFYTATYTDPKDEDLALRLGADRFIVKPVEPDEFIKIIQGLIRGVEKGKVEPKTLVLEEEEKEVFKLYSERLVKKLEMKMLDLKREMTNRQQAEDELRESEERFRTIADFTYDGEFWIGPDGHYIYVSPSCKRITGYGPEEFVNDPGLLEKIVHPDDHSTVVSHLRASQINQMGLSIDFRIITRSGDERWISHNCQPVYDAGGTYLGRRASNRDISKRKKMQEELMKAKRLESLGVLAGGIAHDFNNILTSVLGNISLAKMDIRPDSKVFELLNEAEKAALRTKELTARLITFSKGGEPVKEDVSVAGFLKDSVSSALSGSDIDCEFSMSDDLWHVEIDVNQAKQVIHNIVVNARDAMSEEGSIKVYCVNTDVSVEEGLTLKEGKYVKISIQDQGAGIVKENLSKIFDPYFSTKGMGSKKGMGLGLAVCHSIVKKHAGLIAVESELGSGTTAHIYLPASEKEIKEPVPVKKPIAERPMTGKGKILVMDDEEMVRDVSAALLAKFGYEVELAIDGVEAIEFYKKAKESGQPFDAVILDLTNQLGMGGVEAIKKLLEIDPGIRGIVATGYSNDPVVTNFRAYGFCGAMTKPFTLYELEKGLEEALGIEG